jgi:CHAT domain-containing protein/Tfp pilus assembly protein PilF
MRGFAFGVVLFIAAGSAIVSGGALAQPKALPQKEVQAAQLDDTRSRQLLQEAQGLLQRGDYPAAEAASLRLLEENIRTFGPDHPNVATALNLLGACNLKQGKFNEAEGNFRRMLTIYERRLGPDHEYTAAALNSLALVLERMGDYPGAETLLRRSLAILDKKLGRNHPDTATTLSNLSRVLDSQGKFAAGTAGQASTSNSAGLSAKAQEAVRRGQFAEAETLQEQVLAIHERTLGAENATTANSMANLGFVYTLQGKYVEAEKLYRRSLAVRERVLGPDHPDVATNLNNLAKVLMELGKDEQITRSEARARARTGGVVGASTDIEAMFRRALAIQDRTLGRDHPSTALTLNNYGGMLAVRGDYAQAEQMQRAALGTMEKVFGEQHPDTAAVLTSLSLSLDRQGKIAEAESSYQRAVGISRKTGNPRNLLINASNLGYSLAKRGRYREALPYYKEAVETVDFLYSQTRGYSEETRATFLQQFSAVYRETIKVLLKLNQQNPGRGYDREALAIASRNQSRVFTEMMRQADVARFSGEPAFVKARETRDGLQERLAQLRQGRATVPVTLANANERVAEFDKQITQVSIDLIGAEERLTRDYPRFMELTNPRPVTVEDLQKTLLRPEEALLSYVLLPQETVIFVVTRDDFRMVVSHVRRADIAERVHGIRRSIDKVAIGESVLFLRDIEPDTLASLYRDLVEPVVPLLKGRSKVLVVSDGPLQTIPFELFVTRYDPEQRAAFQRTKEAADGSAARPYLAEYGGLSYLGRAYRFAYLPSLSSLASQRLYPKRAALSRIELVAFADPVFNADASRAMPRDTQQALAQLHVPFAKTGGGAPNIPRLAETAEEAKEIAKALGGTSRLYVGDQAQESTVKTAGDLRSARFVLFATHGFLGGEYVASDLPVEEAEARRHAASAKAGPQAQPALALTLVGDLKGEDGLLTMKEVIEDLELNAELVALSACNTAGESAQANNGEGFAGLTRAFMYAGAKALLVSHWSVDSLSTQQLMTSTFRNIKAGRPALTAVNDAQGELLKGRYNRGEYHFSRAHPFFWAAFVYVGD